MKGKSACSERPPGVPTRSVRIHDGRVPRHVLLEERRLLDAVGPAHHRDRAVAQVRQHHVGDGEVVGEHVGLRGAGERVEHLARVGQLRPADRGGRGGRRLGGVDGHPGPAAGARLVGRVGVLRDDPAEALLADGGDHLRPARGEHRREPPVRARQRQVLQQCAPLAERQIGDVAAVEVQEVADPEVAADELAVQEHGGGAEGRAELAQRRRLDLGALGVGDPGAPAVDADDHPSAAEAHLQPPVVAAGERARGGLHRAGVAGERVAVGARVGAAQDPVVAGADEDVAALGPPPAQPDDDLPRVPLLRLVGAGVPDRHAAAAVLARRDLAGELQVLDGVVLGAHGQPHGVRLGGQALGHRPRRQHAVALEPHVPVQAAGVVLLHHEPVVGAGRRIGLGDGLRRARRVALAAVLLQRHGPTVVRVTVVLPHPGPRCEHSLT